MLQKKVHSDLLAQGRLANKLAGYTPRDAQQALALDIASAIDSAQILLAEAETGTGKTLAYLLPVLHSKQRCLISTHTRALQDQIMQRDLPSLTKALGISPHIALLKGRANYVCPHRLMQSMQDGRISHHRRGILSQVLSWFEKHPAGELSSLSFDVFERGVSNMVTASAEQCLGRNKCELWEECPLVMARAQALDADIIIVNHSLLLADAALKSGEFGELLPKVTAYILDEAHAIPDTASRHFGLTLGMRRFLVWQQDMVTALDALGDETVLELTLQQQMQKLAIVHASGDLVVLAETWLPLIDAVTSRAERGEDMGRLAERALLIAEDIQRLQQPEEGCVVWQEGQGEHLRHMLAPVDVGPLLVEHLWKQESAFVLLSATLRVSEKFDYACQRLGLGSQLIKDNIQGVEDDDDEEDDHDNLDRISQTKTVFYPSPFNYKKQAQIYIPADLPTPRHPDYDLLLVERLFELLRCSRGRAFVLFTSYRALYHCAPLLAAKLSWPVLQQGKDGSRQHLITRFRQETHSILCGTRSFWEGVDVPGESLSMVIIDKIPFAAPSDPLLQARIRHCEEAGGNGFRDIQLPEAIAILRQGLGRLIRVADDTGVMALLDTRVLQKSYGRTIIANLPPAPIVYDINEVSQFFSNLPGKQQQLF
ncbi:MAG: ATP-dependent DNA helicase [Mariprofundales bacterium]